MRKVFTFALLGALGTMACASPKDADGNPVARIPTDSTAYYRVQFENASALSAEKDSLVTELSEITRLVADVNTELATISTSPSSVTPTVDGEGSALNSRTEMLAKVKDLTARVKRSESRLATTSRRLRNLTSESDSMKVVLSSYASSIADLQSLVEGQKVTIETLTGELEQVRELNTRLASSNAELVDTVGALETRENTVYYLIGTKKDLLKQGVIVEEGGTRFLLFTRTGETLRPAAKLDPSLFQMADRRQLTEVMLPNPDKEYQLVSRQNLAYATAPELEPGKGKFRGNLQIVEPAAFWGASKYLIIVEK